MRTNVVSANIAPTSVRRTSIRHAYVHVQMSIQVQSGGSEKDVSVQVKKDRKLKPYLHLCGSTRPTLQTPSSVSSNQTSNQWFRNMEGEQ
jgi:hypothetical protein